MFWEFMCIVTQSAVILKDRHVNIFDMRNSPCLQRGKAEVKTDLGQGCSSVVERLIYLSEPQVGSPTPHKYLLFLGLRWRIGNSRSFSATELQASLEYTRASSKQKAQGGLLRWLWQRAYSPASWGTTERSLKFRCQGLTF